MLMLPGFQRRLRSQRGFTLIELLIVVAIIAILAAILIPNFLRARAQSQVAATKGNLKNVATALESYFVDFAQYPLTATIRRRTTCCNPTGRTAARDRRAGMWPVATGRIPPAVV